jgi:hypothetical protein
MSTWATKARAALAADAMISRAGPLMKETESLSSLDVDAKWFFTKSDTWDRLVSMNSTTLPSRRRLERELRQTRLTRLEQKVSNSR